MARALRILFALSCIGTLWAQPVNLARQALHSADSRSTSKDPKYGIHRAFDGAPDTHWASTANPSLPHVVRVKWSQPVTFDTIRIDVFAKELPRLYATWSSFELRLDNGVTRRIDEPTNDMRIVRFDKPQTCTALELNILAVAAPKTYLGLDELAVYLDPNRSIQPPRTLAFKSRSLKAVPKGRAQHPCVSVTPDELARARKRADSTEWGRREKKATLAQAAPWLEHDDAHWRAFLPEPGACYAYGFTGCPVCGASFGTWGGARCSWKKPGQVTCGKGHAFPNAQHPDDGAGYQAKDGRMHYFRGIWNAWVTEQWTTSAIPALANAYALTGDEIYAARAGLFLDLLASIYPESTSGSWDYPSSPPSGRFARPWYQVARTLVVFIDAYDLIYSSDTLDRPSLRPEIQRTFPPSPRLQKRAVGTVDANGVSHADMTRRENIDRNLVMDGGGYCFEHSFSGGLHNGHADYMRGALAAGALLGIEHWVTNAVDSPYSIYSMLANNADRDGRYYETSLGYALHARNLYLTYVLPLRNWRSERHPNGIDLFDDARMRSFYYLPASVMLCAGHTPNYGDAGPDSSCRVPGKRPFTRTDYQYAEWLAAFAHGEARERGLRILGFLTEGNVPRARLNSSASFRQWMLFHAADIPDNVSQTLPDDLAARVNGCWTMGQKGISILRDGKEADAQAALLRFGPSLNHGDRDDLGLLYYGRGWQLTYEIGYGLGSTHCQVGWGSSTASHCLVTVNERDQGGASGGSLRLFADLPSVKWIEAESPLSYSLQGVTQYRRTVALVGRGRNQVLVDVFRVRGGQQHDYGVGVQSRNVTIEGIKLGPEEEGSLAEDGSAWGEKVGADGDIKGYPNKPYWNPPPGNGYGFFFDMRRAEALAPFITTYALGGRTKASLRLHALPEPDTEAILCKAPGLYPRNPDASYLLLRRRCPDDASLNSAFACVMEPYGLSPRSDAIPGSQLQGLVVDTSARHKYIGSYDIVFLGGTKPGDHITFEVMVSKAGTYTIAADLLRSPSYGKVRLLVDGAPLGGTFDAGGETIQGPDRFVFGDKALALGPHRFRFELVEGERYYAGVAGLALLAQGAPKAPLAEPAPVVALAERIPVGGGDGDMTPVAVHIQRDGRDEYLLSAALEGEELHTVKLPAGTLSWRGALVFAAFRNGTLDALATHGAWDVTLDGASHGPVQGRKQGRIIAIDYENSTVDLDVELSSEAVDKRLYIENPAYSRSTTYRIEAVTALPDGGTRVGFGEQSMLLGRGHIFDITQNGTLLSDVPHDYGRSVVGGVTTRFFDGKLVANGKGARTVIKELRYGKPMEIAVESAQGFHRDDTLLYYDVREGDSIYLPTQWEWTKDTH